MPPRAKSSSARAEGNLNDELRHLTDVARRHGRQLHNVPGDNKCQFHALLHSWEQVEPASARLYNADTLRTAIVNVLARQDLQRREWIAPGDSDAAPVGPLRATLAATASRRGQSVVDWLDAMRNTHEWGDNNTLIGFALLARRSVNVITTSGVRPVVVPPSFGNEFQPLGDVWVANETDRHYQSTTGVARFVLTSHHATSIRDKDKHPPANHTTQNPFLYCL